MKLIAVLCTTILLSCTYTMVNISNHKSGSVMGMCAPLTRNRPFDQRYLIRDKIITTTNDMGIRFIRAGFQWKFIQPEKDKWDWAVYDAVIESARKHNTKILAILHAPPRWAIPINDHFEDWDHFVKALLTRYGDYIKDWEIWNEPNVEKYWPTDVPIKHFIEIQKRSYKTIKKQYPDASVILGGLSCNRVAFDFWKTLFKGGVLDYCDGVGMHPYRFESTKIIDYVDDTNKLIKKYTDVEKEIWITEFGIGFRNKTSPDQTKEEYDHQSNLLIQTVLSFIVAGGDQFFIFAFMDKKIRDNKLHKKNVFLGVMREDFTPKPAVDALTWLSKILSEYNYISYKISGDDSMLIEFVNDNGQTAFITWGKSGIKSLRNQKIKGKLIRPESYEKKFAQINNLNDFDFEPSDEDVILWKIEN